MPHEDFFSRLAVRTNGDAVALERSDYCPSCWAQAASKIDNPIFWKTRRKDADETRNLVDINTLNALFLNLIEDSRPEIEGLRYVVALLLIRKKLLKVVRGAKVPRGDLVFRDPRDTEKRMHIPTPDLSEDSLELLKEQLGQILG